MKDLLNEAQYASLAIVLRQLEDDLHQADTWLRGAEENGILYRRKLRLSPERRAAARQVIATALNQVTELAREFDLSQVDDNPSATVIAEMSERWANLCDARADKLKRYGDVDPRLSQALDPSLDRLIELTLALMSTLRNGAMPTLSDSAEAVASPKSQTGSPIESQTRDRVQNLGGNNRHYSK